MNPTVILTLFALSIAVLSWTLIDLGLRLLQAWRLRFTRDSRFQLRELFLFVDPGRLYAFNLALCLCLALLIWLFTASVLLALLCALLLAFSPGLLFRWLRSRRLTRIEQQLPDALQLLAGHSRAGLSLNAALRQLTEEIPPPLGQELALLQREQRLGVSFDDAMENLGLRIPSQSMRLMVSALRIAADSGGGLTETLQRTAASLRQQRAMELKIAALTAQGKLQAWVVGLLPLLLWWILQRMEPETMALLWSTRFGWGLIAAIIVLETAGVLLIRRIVNIDI